MYCNIPNFSDKSVTRWGVGGAHIINCVHRSGIVTQNFYMNTPLDNKGFQAKQYCWQLKDINVL